MSGATAMSVIAEWQRRLAQHVAAAGSGDPAVLAQMPGLRSPAVLRPGQIVFAATDVEAFVAERDGYDVFGLLLGRQDSPAGQLYVFVVGTVERRNYRSIGVVDIRLAAMTVRNGAAQWQTSSSEAASLTQYRQSADPTAAVRFPADRDQFRMTACPQGLCVEESAWVPVDAVYRRAGRQHAGRVASLTGAARLSAYLHCRVASRSTAAVDRRQPAARAPSDNGPLNTRPSAWHP
jgi:hypothetical protein